MGLPSTYTEDKKAVNAIIETPYKSRNKYTYDENTGMFKLSKVLPSGLVFPCDMGFIAGTKGGDGDPIDILILMDELTFPGCVVECRLVGIIEATQKEKDKKEVRNDRLLAVPVAMKDMDRIKDVKEISKNKLQEIIKFFEFYNLMADKKFTLVKVAGKKEANLTLKKAEK